MSACGVLAWNDGHLVWDDYLDHRDFALAEGAERVVRHFVDWGELESVRRLGPAPVDGDRFLRIARELLDSDILVARDSERERRERDILAAWGTWGPATRAFHFSTRSHAGTRYATAAEMDELLNAKFAEDPPPPALLSVPGTRRVPLPVADAAPWHHRDLLEVLRRRRSEREFGDSHLSLAALGALLRTAAAPLPDSSGRLVQPGESLYKTSPSGGARHPTELYVYAQRVAGLEPGIYHYAAGAHALEEQGRQRTPGELVTACGGQEWVAGANAIIFYTSVIARNQWKYPIPRTYRILMMDVGHLSQTVYLLATALGLRITFTAALRDEMVEQLVGCDPAHQIVVGASVLGTDLDA
jgi:SagB-type dehydrogenase family enzyme